MALVKLLLGAILRPFTVVFDWLLEKPIRGVLAVFALFAAGHLCVIDPHLREQRDDWQAASAKWEEAALKWQEAHNAVLALSLIHI